MALVWPRSDLMTAVTGSWVVWVPAHTVNFAFIPPSQRLLYINTIQIGYNIFLSFLGNKKVRLACLPVCLAVLLARSLSSCIFQGSRPTNASIGHRQVEAKTIEAECAGSEKGAAEASDSCQCK